MLMTADLKKKYLKVIDHYKAGWSHGCIQIPIQEEIWIMFLQCVCVLYWRLIGLDSGLSPMLRHV